MGEAQANVFEPEFNRSFRSFNVSCIDQRYAWHAGKWLVREVGQQLGGTESLAGPLVDPRRQDRLRY